MYAVPALVVGSSSPRHTPAALPCSAAPPYRWARMGRHETPPALRAGTMLLLQGDPTVLAQQQLSTSTSATCAAPLPQIDCVWPFSRRATSPYWWSSSSTSRTQCATCQPGTPVSCRLPSAIGPLASRGWLSCLPAQRRPVQRQRCSFKPSSNVQADASACLPPRCSQSATCISACRASCWPALPPQPTAAKRLCLHWRQTRPLPLVGFARSFAAGLAAPQMLCH